jgi:hypothetical protein
MRLMEEVVWGLARVVIGVVVVFLATAWVLQGFPGGSSRTRFVHIMFAVTGFSGIVAAAMIQVWSWSPTIDLGALLPQEENILAGHVLMYVVLAVAATLVGFVLVLWTASHMENKPRWAQELLLAGVALPVVIGMALILRRHESPPAFAILVATAANVGLVVWFWGAERRQQDMYMGSHAAKQVYHPLSHD